MAVIEHELVRAPTVLPGEALWRHCSRLLEFALVIEVTAGLCQSSRFSTVVCIYSITECNGIKTHAQRTFTFY